MHDNKQARIQRVGAGGARPPLGQSFIMQNALFNSIRAPVHHWAPTPGRNPVSAPDKPVRRDTIGPESRVSPSPKARREKEEGGEVEGG